MRTLVGFRTLIALSVLLWAVSLPRATLAQPSPALAEGAGATGSERIVEQAVSAYATGDLARARKLFEEAHFADPTARTLRGLAVLAYREGDFVAAIHGFEASLTSEVKPLTPELRSGVQQLLARSQAALAQLTLTLSPALAEVTSDGGPAARDAEGRYLLVPGQRELRVAAPGHVTRQLSLVVAAGDKLALDVALPALAEEMTAPVVQALSPRTVEVPTHGSSGNRRLRRAGIGLVAVGVAALVVSAVSGGVGVVRLHRVEDHCRANDDMRCGREELDALVADKRLDALATLSTVAAVTSGLGAASGATLWLLAHRQESRGTAFSFGVRAHF